MTGVSEERWQELAEILPLMDRADGTYWWSRDGIQGKPGDRVLRITYAPILPTAIGEDQDGVLYTRLTWITPQGREVSRWMLEQQTRDPSILRDLPGSPVDAVRAREVSRWVAYASPYVTTPTVKLVTRMGWVGERFYWPGAMADRIWPHDPIECDGDVAATARALRTLASLPDGQGHLALVVAGLSAASPLIRHSRSRNPIIGLAQSSSRGKSTAARFALSFWGLPETWTMGASASAKSIEDQGCMFPDTPLFVDDLHLRARQNPESVAGTLYFMGNGQRRHLAAQRQGATLAGAIGGQMRYGVSIYAAEHEILSGGLGGIQYRTWELEGDPMPNGKVAREVELATHAGAGAVGRLLAEAYSMEFASWGPRLDEDWTNGPDTVDSSCLAAGDIKAVRALAWGLATLRRVTGVHEINVPAICGWLVSRIQASRSQIVDTVAAAWDALVAGVLGGAWGKDIVGGIGEGLKTYQEDELRINGEVIARREQGLFDSTWVLLEINPASQFATRITAKFGSERTLLKAWAERGYIQRSGTGHLKWQVRGHGRTLIRLSEQELIRWTRSDEGQAVVGPTSAGIGGGL